MIDLHCHILPGIDDGAADLSESVAMAREAQHDGIEAVCATPHIRHDHDVRIAEIAPRVRDLNRELGRRGVGVEVLPGGEVAETALERLEEPELAAVTLGAGPWVLLEPAPGPLSDSLERRVRHLSARGRRALIAHPERHLGADLFERLARLVAGGALVQATADFFVREDTSAGMLELAGRGLVHVLGSDSHSSRFGREARLSAALGVLERSEALAPHLDWVARVAPRAIVAGDPLQAPFEPR
ncbi:MAG: CpsB/CapC family capsule biosynthesis tyrosine phosphatase [Solirubrobacterales bacterium]